MASAAEALRKRKLARALFEESKRAKTSHTPPPSVPAPNLSTPQATKKTQITSTDFQPNASRIILVKLAGEDMARRNGKSNRNTHPTYMASSDPKRKSQHERLKEKILLPTGSIVGTGASRGLRGRTLERVKQVKTERGLGDMELESRNRLSNLPQRMRDKTLTMAVGETPGCSEVAGGGMEVDDNSETMEMIDGDNFEVTWTRDGNFVMPKAAPKVTATKDTPSKLQEKKVGSAKPFRFLDLPRSIRDRTYKIILPVDGQLLVPMIKQDFSRYPTSTRIDSAYALIQCCRSIHNEMEELLVRNNTAYVPIVPGRIYDERNLKIAHDAGYEGEGFITAFRGLKDFQKTYFRVHCDSPFIGERLIKAVELFVAMSANVSATMEGQRRMAIVHLDEYYMWLPNNCGPRKTIDLLHTMAFDKYTSWTLMWTMNTDTYLSAEHLFQDIVWLKQEIQKINGKQGNIELKAEIYGQRKPFWEEIMEELTRDIHPGSMIWEVKDY